VPWWTVVNRLDEDILALALKERRSIGLYDIDGIVVGQDRVPMWQTDPNELRNPKDMVAFKMVLSDQCAETTVVAVHWALSHQGYYIPRLEVEPVRVGGAMITYVTGHNARMIVDKRLGKGARIRIRRSGDVIPTIDGVLTGVEPSLPSATLWKWMGPEDTAVHIGAKDDGGSVELLESKLKHFASVMEIEGLGPGLVKKLVLGGITTPKALCAASADTLSNLVGKKTGASIADELRKALATLTEKRLMIASSTLPRGVGETKLDTLFAVEADPRKWGSSTKRPGGWSEEGLTEFLRAYPVYEAWRAKEFPVPAYPILSTHSAPALPAYKGTICFSGFRNMTLEKRLEDLGFVISATVTKKTTGLVVPDGEIAESSKVTKARELGIAIRRQTDFLKEYNLN
jgi:DNA ligase (NAD+)